jgi:hypothetical protein
VFLLFNKNKARFESKWLKIIHNWIITGIYFYKNDPFCDLWCGEIPPSLVQDMTLT